MTMQQVMAMVQGLQDEMAESRAEQERMKADLAASQARNEELIAQKRNCVAVCATTKGNATQMRPNVSPPQGSFPHHSRRRSWRR